MHAYRMQKLIEAYGKDRVVNVRSRASLYQTIERLVRLGLVEVRETVRPTSHPERTVYAIADAGRETAREWLRAMLHTTGREFPEFITAVLHALRPGAGRRARAARAPRRAARRSARDAEAELQRAPAALPRLFLLEEEYRRTVLAAELEWIRGVIDDLREGQLTSSERWLRDFAAAFRPSDDDAKES